MGKVTTKIKITSYDSLRDFKKGFIGQNDIKTVELDEVVVDSGASMLCLNKEMIEKLDLEFLKTVKVNIADGVVERGIYGPVVYEIQGRVARGDVMELAHPRIKALVGQIPLEQLDFLINPSSNRLIPNPEHDGELILDQLIVTEDLKFEIIEE